MNLECFQYVSLLRDDNVQDIRGSSRQYNFESDNINEIRTNYKQYNFGGDNVHDVGGSSRQHNSRDDNVHDDNVNVGRMPKHSAHNHHNQEHINSEPSSDEENDYNDDDDNDGLENEMYNEQGRGDTSERTSASSSHIKCATRYVVRVHPIIPFFSTAYSEIPAYSFDLPLRRLYYDLEKGVLEKRIRKDCVKDFSVRTARRVYCVVERNTKLWKVECQHSMTCMEHETVPLTSMRMRSLLERNYHADAAGYWEGKYSRIATRLHLSQKHAQSLERVVCERHESTVDLHCEFKVQKMKMEEWDNEIKKLKEEINILREANHQANEKHLRLTHVNAQLRERAEQSEGLVDQHLQTIEHLNAVVHENEEALDGALETMAQMHGQIEALDN
ncbi:hypothetical protein DH2020_002494 [Rehmannia glutinosa]|uniref:Uncharacterized protein n=1 Tax=Rehmannia glutinosa TaxID=99300 RepID=A0ABR0XU80_REHGL